MKREQKSISMAKLAEMFLPYMTTDSTQTVEDYANSFQHLIHDLINGNKHFANHCYDFTFSNESDFESWADIVFESAKKHSELDKIPIRKIYKNENEDE